MADTPNTAPDCKKTRPPATAREGEFDCNDAPMTALSYQLIAGPRGYHGLAITPDGLMIGSDGSSLVESTYDGMWGVFIPGLGNGQQFDWLPDGDLAHATDDDAITRLGLDGTTSVIRPSVNAYGVILGPDQMLYVTSDWGGDNEVSRIDPTTGDIELLLTGGEDEVHSIAFNLDYTRMYVGTIGAGNLYYVELDAELNPTTGMMLLSNQVGFDNGWHDAVVVDICGYIYVPDFWSRYLFRIAPNGETVIFWTPPNGDFYAHGLVWGTGEHGWRQDALYFPQPYNGNTVGEIITGVPSRDWNGTALNPLEPL